RSLTVAALNGRTTLSVLIPSVTAVLIVVDETVGIDGEALACQRLRPGRITRTIGCLMRRSAPSAGVLSVPVVMVIRRWLEALRRRFRTAPPGRARPRAGLLVRGAVVIRA